MSRIHNINDTVISHSSFIRPHLTAGQQQQQPQQTQHFIQTPKVVVAQNPTTFNVNDYIKYRYPFKYAILHVAVLVFINVVVLTLEVVLTLKNTAAANVYGIFFFFY